MTFEFLAVASGHAILFELPFDDFCMLSCLAMVFYLKNLMIFFSARLPILYTEKETSWLSSMQDWL